MDALSSRPLQGSLHKMRTRTGDTVQYSLPLSSELLLPMNNLLGSRLELQFNGTVACIHCGRRGKKSFGQGYCWPCFQRLAECDACITRPELCHYHLGTCRDPAWGETHCLNDHVVYLANASGIKVGITRASQVPFRWMDQGAVAAVPIYRAATRRLAGLMEVALKQHVSDRTQWQTMLKGEPEAVDLADWRQRLHAECEPDAEALRREFGLTAVQALESAEIQHFQYPVLQYPDKVRSLNPLKLPTLGGVLQGIKGQYLIFDTGVINIRNHAGYEVQLTQA